MKQYLFSYGTLQKENVQLDLFGRLLNGAKDVLPGYKLLSIRLKGDGHYNLIAIPSTDNTDGVKGTVFKISPDELRISDKYEPEEYKRVKLVLQSGREAWVYVAA